MQKHDKFYELVRCDKLLKLFIPLKISRKHANQGIIDVAKHLFQKAFSLVFKCENLNIQLNDLIVRRLDDEHVLLISRFVLPWQNILDFWNIIQDVLYATTESNERVTLAPHSRRLVGFGITTTCIISLNCAPNLRV